MTFTSLRIALAKLIAPGVFRSNEALRLSAQQSSSLSRMFSAQAVKLEERVAKAELALKQIRGMRTPSCAHIGKRMADIAESALKNGEA